MFTKKIAALDRKKTRQYLYLFISAVAILLILNAIYGIEGRNTANAGSQHNLSGYVWSDNIGWISFNCTNTSTCGVSDYGVNVDTVSGNMSGYAWSGNIGWISFNETAGCPESGCTTQPKANVITGSLTGWAKVLSVSGGWDGWIKLGGSWSSSATFAGTTVSGYSWGSDVVGWISWNSSTPPVYGVTSSVSVTNSPPVASISSPAVDISVYTNQQVLFDGTATDANGTVVAYEWLTDNCSTGTLFSSAQTFSQTLSVGTYVIYFRAQDNQGAWSTSCPSRTITVSVPPAIDGACGSANGVSIGTRPTTNLCSTGPASTVLPATGPGPWSWTCGGSYGGADANCAAPTSCGNSTCEPAKSENPSTCRSDCQMNFKEF